MNMDAEIAEIIAQLPPEDLQFVCKLVCLIRFCPGFNEELEQIPTDGAMNRERIEATNALMEKWLYEEGWAEILRPDLERVGGEGMNYIE